MTLDELLRALGITEKDADLERIVDGAIPRIDYVDLGANGYGDRGWLVKKGRKKMSFGSLQQDKKGNWTFVAKGLDDGDGDAGEAVKISSSHKQAVSEMLAAGKAQIEALEKALGETEEDETATEIPESIKTILADMSKSVQPEGEPSNEDGAAPAADPAPTPAPQADDGTFSVGDLVVTGGLAKLAKGWAEAAGSQMEDDEFSKKFAEALSGMAAMQSVVDPETATAQAVAAVNKRMDSQVAELRAQNEKLQKTVNAMVANGFAGGLVIPDGSPQPAPVQKSKKPALPMGSSDVNDFIEQYNQ